MIPTPHIGATDRSMVAESILLPGDPLRAKFIAENFLEDAVQFNAIRNMFGYTGTYKGKKVSVMGTGMGMASMGLYSYELIHFYGCKNLIRIGTCGAMQPDIELTEIIIPLAVSVSSNYASQYQLNGTFSPTASWPLLKKAIDVAEQKQIKIRPGNVLSSDFFYHADAEDWKKWAAMGVLAAEMESGALYMNAAQAGVNALTILTVSDSIVHHSAMSAEDRQTSYRTMMELALEVV